MFAHIPGLRVVMPVVAGTRLRPAARRDPRSRSGGLPRAQAHLPPVKGEVEDDGEALPLDVAFVLRDGRDVTLVSWGAMVKETSGSRR